MQKTKMETEQESIGAFNYKQKTENKMTKIFFIYNIESLV
jgi:hypothetical protein